MGFLNHFLKSPPTLLRLPAGSFTVDRTGCMLVGTLPSSFPAEVVKSIGKEVLSAFRTAADAQLPLAELIVHYPSLKITARELRGGAIIFLAPTGANPPAHPS